MARGINKVILVGNLGKDPEVRYTSGGGAVANLTIATSEQWMDKQSGNKVEKTEWHRVVMFGKLGEIAGEYLRKGSQVYIEGRLQTRQWEKDGVKRYSTEIVANDMQMLGSKNSQAHDNSSTSQSHGGHGSQAGAGDTASPAQAPVPANDFDDDIPF